jgi:hypothetical protein
MHSHGASDSEMIMSLVGKRIRILKGRFADQVKTITSYEWLDGQHCLGFVCDYNITNNAKVYRDIRAGIEPNWLYIEGEDFVILKKNVPKEIV